LMLSSSSSSICEKKSNHNNASLFEIFMIYLPIC
jgi:hypothetical protein